MLCAISFVSDTCSRNTSGDFESRRRSTIDSFFSILSCGASIGTLQNLLPVFHAKALHPISECCACGVMISLPTSGGKPGQSTLVLAVSFDTPPFASYVSIFEGPRRGKFVCAASCGVIMFFPEHPLSRINMGPLPVCVRGRGFGFDFFVQQWLCPWQLLQRQG